jgi:hypothetical protein
MKNKTKNDFFCICNTCKPKKMLTVININGVEFDLMCEKCKKFTNRKRLNCEKNINDWF